MKVVCSRCYRAPSEEDQSDHEALIRRAGQRGHLTCYVLCFGCACHLEDADARARDMEREAKAASKDEGKPAEPTRPKEPTAHTAS